MKLHEYINLLSKEIIFERIKITPQMIEKVSDDLIERILFLKENGFMEWGEGSSRIVFLVDSKRVIKMAKSDAGIAQNKKEIDLYFSSGEATKKLITKIYSYAKDYSWIIAELVRELKKEDFEGLLGFSYYMFKEVMEEYDKTKNISNSFYEKRNEILGLKKENPQREKELSLYLNDLNNFRNSSFLKKLLFFIRESKLEISDLIHLNHWGKTVDNRVVLLDYGFDEDILRKYYSPKMS